MKRSFLLPFFLSLLAAPAAAREVEVLDKLTVKGGVEISTSSTASPLIFASSTTSQGRVGIGTTVPTSTLTVSGTLTALEITCSTCTGMQRRVVGECSTGSQIRQVNQDGSVICEIVSPPSTIFLSTAACPTGFLELPSFAGRYILGMPTGGTLNGVSGTADADLASISHTHTFTGTAGINTGSTDLAHTHQVDLPNTTSGTPSATTCVWQSVNAPCDTNVPYNTSTHDTNIVDTTSAGASISLNHNHTFTPAGTTSASDYAPPYIQVRVCMKL